MSRNEQAGTTAEKIRLLVIRDLRSAGWLLVVPPLWVAAARFRGGTEFAANLRGSFPMLAVVILAGTALRLARDRFDPGRWDFLRTLPVSTRMIWGAKLAAWFLFAAAAAAIVALGARI